MQFIVVSHINKNRFYDVFFLGDLSGNASNISVSLISSGTKLDNSLISDTFKTWWYCQLIAFLLVFSQNNDNCMVGCSNVNGQCLQDLTN